MKLALKWYTIQVQYMKSYFLVFLYSYFYISYFLGDTVRFLDQQTVKIEKFYFVPLIPYFRYNLLQKTLTPPGSDDITKKLTLYLLPLLAPFLLIQFSSGIKK